MALAGKSGGNFFVVNSITGQIKHPVTHFRSSCEFGNGVDLHLDFEVACSAAAPNYSDHSDIVVAAIEHDLVDKTPQQRFALSIRGSWIGPNMREAPGEADDFAMQDLAHSHLTDRLWQGLLSKRLFSRPDFVQGHFPASLEFCGDEAIVGVDLVELAFC
jgi:hypothetical protein